MGIIRRNFFFPINHNFCQFRKEFDFLMPLQAKVLSAVLLDLNGVQWACVR